jgi:uncharacterized membrane protein YfcA
VEIWTETFLLFLAVGFAAQIVDGALGMAYGLVSSSVLLAFGVPPATASASVHAAEVFTTGASAASHMRHKNVNWRLFFPLAFGGIAGGVLGAYVLTGLEGSMIKPFVIGYLGLMGVYILYRAMRNHPPRHVGRAMTLPLGLGGGFLDAVGGGGWGPTVTSTLVGAGLITRQAIGTGNTAEFFVTVAVSATFIWALVTGRWEDAHTLQSHAAAVAGLIVGGLVAAPFAGLIAKIVPHRAMSWLVGLLILGLAAWQLAQIRGLI